MQEFNDNIKGSMFQLFMLALYVLFICNFTERRVKSVDISGLTQYLVLVVVGICLCVGYVIKKSLTFIPNKYIPLIMLVLGLVSNIIINVQTITAEVILAGMLSGLASTGLYETFRNLIERKDDK